MRSLPPGRLSRTADASLPAAAGHALAHEPADAAPPPAGERRPGMYAVVPAARRVRPPRRRPSARPAAGILASELSPLLLRRHYPLVAELLAELGALPCAGPKR